MEDNRQQSENSPINLEIFSQAEQGMMSFTPEAQIYKDPKSPYFTAPKNVKEYLLKNKMTDNSLNLNEINLDEFYFEPMPTENHLCMRYFGRDEEKYYHCYECTGESWSVNRVVFCESCFVLQNHIGHHYYMQRAKRRDQYCDCGSQNKTTLQMVCPKHNQNQKINIQIKEADRQYFINTFRSLIDVACYLDCNSDLIDKVCQKLSTLCEYSGFYSKLSLQLFMMESTHYKETTKSKYYLTILASNNDVNRILFQICGNNEQNMELAKFMTKNYEKIRENSNYSNIDDSLYKVICDFKTMDKLAHEGYFAKQTYFIYQEFAEVDKQHSRYLKQSRNLYLRFIKYLFKTETKMKVQKFLKFGIKDKDITNSQIAWQFLKQIISIYPYKKKSRVISYKSHSSNNSNQKNGPKKGKKPNEDLFKHQQISYYMKYIHVIVMRCVAIITQGNWLKILNFRQNFMEHGICLKSFQYILLQIAYFADSYIFNNQSFETPAFAIVLLVSLFKKSERASILLSHMWLAVVGKNQNIEMAAANVFEAISSIVYFKIHLSIFQGVIKKIKREQFMDKIEESREEKMKSFFMKFLQLRGIIERQQLIDFKNENLLQFEELGKTLRSTCTYNEEDQAFVCNIAATELQFEDKFALALRQTNMQTMSSNIYANKNIYYGFEQNLILEQDVAQVLQFICNSQILLNLLDDIYVLKQKPHNEDVKYGYLYLFTLVMINGFSKGSIKQLNQRVSNLKTMQMLKKYVQNKTQLQLLQRLFCIEKKQAKIQNKANDQCNGNLIMDEKQSKKSQQASKQIERKRKFEEKRKKISEKYQKKQQLVLESIRSKTMDGALFSDEDICLTCHEKNHQQNELVYLGRISVDCSLSQAMHGSQQKSNTSIFTCFHTLHINCFIELHKNNRMRAYMNCPLCNQSVNCFLMRSFNYKNRQLNNIFNNILISNLVVNYKCYNTSNYFILFFKHLLQSKGLGCLVDSAENWQRHKVTDKNDYFIQNLMIKLYDDSNQVQKQIFRSEIQKLIQNIKLCSKDPCKYVQLVIAESLKQKLLSGSNAEIDVELLRNVRMTIKYEEFLIIKQQVEKILKQKIQMPEMEDQPLEQKKQSLSFSLKELPRDSSKFKEFLKDKMCSKNHTAKMDFYCLICGEAVCEECNDQNQSLEHGEISAYLSIEDFILHLKNPTIDQERDIYFNDFRISYNEREQYKMEEDVYILDVIKLSAFIQQFLRQ